MALPTYEELKMLTSNGASSFAESVVSSNTDIDIPTVKAIVAKGCVAIKAEAELLKARAASPKRDALLCAARGAYLIAAARGIA